MERLRPNISKPKQFLQQFFVRTKGVPKEYCLLIAFLLFHFPLLVFSQINIAEVKHFGEKDGLDLSITDIFRGESGMLWLLGRHNSTFYRELESRLIHFDGREFRYLYDMPNPDEIVFQFDELNNDYLILNYIGPFLDVFNTKSGEFESIEIGPFSEEVKRVWSGNQDTIPFTFAVKTTSEVSIFSWDGEQTDSISAIPRNQTAYELAGYFEHDDFLWISDGGIGWMKYDLKDGKWDQYTLEDIDGVVEVPNREQPLTFGKALSTTEGKTVVAIRDVLPGYYWYNQKQDKFEPISGLRDDLISYLPFQDEAGRILFTYWPPEDVEDLTLMDLDGELLDYSPLLDVLDGTIHGIYSEDFTDHLWVGTIKGLTFIKIKSKEKNIEQIRLNYSIRCMTELEPGKLLLSTESNGWFLWNEAQNTIRPFTVFQNGQPLETPYCRGFYEQENDWIWTSSLDGMLEFNPTTREARVYDLNKTIQSFTRLKNGKFLLACDHNPVPIQFDPVTKTYSDFMQASEETSLSERFSHSIVEASDGTIWVGTNQGLVKYDKAGKNVKLYSKNDGLRSYVILSIFEESDGKLWLGTGAGVHIFDPKTEQFEYLQEKDGLANNTVATIFKDQEGDMWFSTFDGISCYKTEEKAFLNFNQEDGFSHFEFNRYSVYQYPDGRLCFGTLNGANLFYPQDLKGAPTLPKLILKEAQFYNWQKHKQTDQYFGFSQLTQINLPPDNRYLHLEFVLSDLINADQHNFSYFLEGYDEGWNDLGNRNEVIFNRLPVGNYTLHLQGVNARGERNVNPVKIDIHVAQYFYRSTWFYLLCLAAVGGAVFWWIMRLRTQKQRLETEVRKRTESIRQDKVVIEKQAAQLQELDRFKSRFYTNITHEFRTPLTVIMGMLEEIKGQEKPKKLIRRNSQNLLNLINQLLDLSKIESGNIKLNLSQGDIIHYIQYLTESFHSLAESRNIRLQTYSEVDELFMAFDPEKLQHIIGNLLSNAIKFTPERGKITLYMAVKETPDPYLLIKVKDNGVGIEPEKLPHIFDLFYQADSDADSNQHHGGSWKGSSSGVGLALVKELVELMNGQIIVESEVGKGTSFEVQLPYTHVETVANMEEAAMIMKENPDETTKLYAHVLPQIESNSRVQETASLSNPNHPILLIIEDNPDVATYIESCLEDHYQLAVAYNGQEGIDKALELIPDLIVSDVMMPEKNGYEVCHILKNDIRTSHIPIVLLTAKIDTASRIEGLEKGADAYLAKPFNQKELLVRLKKLNELRQQLQNKFAAKGNVAPPKDPQVAAEAPTPLEDTFIKKLRDTIEKHIDDPGLGVVHLCRAVHLSHAQVYRKIKALTGQSPSVFIRTIRLQKGLELLKDPEKTVADVAYEVGFSDPNYFSRTFHEQFGKTPSEMRN